MQMCLLEWTFFTYDNAKESNNESQEEAIYIYTQVSSMSATISLRSTATTSSPTGMKDSHKWTCLVESIMPERRPRLFEARAAGPQCLLRRTVEVEANIRGAPGIKKHLPKPDPRECVHVTCAIRGNPSSTTSLLNSPERQ